MNIAENLSAITADLKADNDRADRNLLVREAENAIRAVVGMQPTRFLKAVASDDWHEVGMMFGWAWKIQHEALEFDPEPSQPRQELSDEERVLIAMRREEGL